jgi:hypothetical protein
MKDSCLKKFRTPPHDNIFSVLMGDKNFYSSPHPNLSHLISSWCLVWKHVLEYSWHTAHLMFTIINQLINQSIIYLFKVFLFCNHTHVHFTLSYEAQNVLQSTFSHNNKTTKDCIQFLNGCHLTYKQITLIPWSFIKEFWLSCVTNNNFKEVSPIFP